MIVPDKKVAVIPVIPDPGVATFDMDFSTFLNPLNKDHKRDWFTPNFYRCLPLSIGNMQGFIFSVPFSFTVFWNGGARQEDTKIEILNDVPKKVREMNHVNIDSEFGHGIFTAHIPVVLKTPPGVNLMTIAPPNIPVPGISPMTGVIEADNLRFTFTLNFKIDLVDTLITIPKNYPIMGIIPIPRYFCDSFDLVNAYDIIDKEIIEDERQVIREHSDLRNMNKYTENADGFYYKGKDVRGCPFKDHQLPRRNK
jgi:hypothetical protein